MRSDSQSRQKAEQDNDRQRCYECGEPPMTRRIIGLGPSHRKTFPLRSLRYFLAAFLSRNKSSCIARELSGMFLLNSTAVEKLRAHGQQRGKANEHVARFAGLQLREERSANDDDRQDQ